jgi:hypothetical protein
MAQASALASRPTTDGRPAVRLEVRAGGGRPTVYEVGDDGFLIGGVPGCDLRLPGANPSPVLCLISRNACGAALRRLAPVQLIAVNGRPVSSAALNDGDRITLGLAEVVVSVAPSAEPPPGLDERLRTVEAREKELHEQVAQLEEDRVIWYRRRDEVEGECRRQTEAVQEVSQRLRQAERDLDAAREDLEARERTWREANEEATRQHQEATSLRRQMAQIREQLYDRYRQRREKLNARRQAVRRAARKLAERKRAFDAAEARGAAAWADCERTQAELEARVEQFERERGLVEEQQKLIAARQQEVQRELAARFEECESRDREAAEARAALERGQKQHQADLVRLDRLQAHLDERQKQIQQTALEVDRRFEQLQRDTRDLEEQAVQLDEQHNRLAREAEELARRKAEYEAAAAPLDQRAAALEGQQAMLAALRTRLERMREDLRRQEQALNEQRVRQEEGEADLRDRLAAAQRLRAELDDDLKLHAEERRRFEESRAAMDAAVAQLRQAQEPLEARAAEVKQRQEQQDATAAEQAEQAGLLLARAGQLEELRSRLTADRQALADREAKLAAAEQALAALQEQLRRRSDELSERQRALAEQEKRLQEEQAGQEARAAEVERLRLESASGLDALRQELAARTVELDGLGRDVARREEACQADAGRLAEAERALAEQRQALAAERVAWEAGRQTAAEADERVRQESAAAKAEALELTRQLPELEARATAAFDRMLRAREQLREHLAEVHAYARQGRDDLEAARQEVRDEAERVRRAELDLHAARDEHRLAVAAFRQQLIEWQGQVGEMRQALLRDETRLDRRKAEVDEEAQRLASASARLAEQAEQVHRQERAAAERRTEVERHLSDMREWYRKKLRELSGVDAPAEAGAEGGDVLTLAGEAGPGDRRLGDLLLSLGLVDADTLAALLLEARRRRRPLRQALLAGNYLTLYQMALIEAGNLDGLVLGPVRVVDRLQAGPRETVYRVFDPRADREALLRWLAEAEMHDAVRPDEFRQRFTAASAVRHVHVAAVYEVLEIGGRPAVLQEWLTGLPGTDWPPTASAPGVWLRLLAQAALGLRTVHEAGLVHGAIGPGSFVCTGDGVLKLCGLGEPRWLAAAADAGPDEGSPEGDLLALGRVAAGWAAAGPRKGAKAKPLPPALQDVLDRLNIDGPEAYADAAAVLEHLDQVGADVAANAAAWERFVREVRQQSADAARRRSA